MEEFTTTFWRDFTIADAFGIDAVKDTYKRAFEEWKDDYRYLTDLVIVLNHKCWQHYERGNQQMSELYQELYYETSGYALDNLKGEEFDYYWKKTDYEVREMTTVVIDKKPSGITHLYDIVAQQLGHDPSKCHYDCTKIEVSENIAQAIEECYNPHDGTSDWKMTFGMHWCCFGPKEDKMLPDNTVRVEDGFIQEV